MSAGVGVKFEIKWRDFPGSPVVQTPQSRARGVGSIPGQGTKIPHEARHGKERKKGG